MQISFRLATQDDLHTFCSWFQTPTELRYWAGSGLRFPPTAETLATDLKWETTRNYVMTESDTVIGCFRASSTDTTVKLACIAVAPDVRSQGYGTRLLQYATSMGPESCAKRFVLYVYETNVRGVNFYKNFGFKESPLPEGEKGFEGCLYLSFSCNDS